MKYLIIFYALILSAFSVNAEINQTEGSLYKEVIRLQKFGIDLTTKGVKLQTVHLHLKDKGKNLTGNESAKNENDLVRISKLVDLIVDIAFILKSASIVAQYDIAIKVNLAIDKTSDNPNMNRFEPITKVHKKLYKETLDELRSFIKDKLQYITKTQIEISNTTAVVTINELIKLLNEMETYLKSKQY